jgi:hypothetical protein
METTVQGYDRRSRFKGVRVETTIIWPDGHITTRIIDWWDSSAVSRFAMVSNNALMKGAEVHTKMIPGGV